MSSPKKIAAVAVVGLRGAVSKADLTAALGQFELSDTVLVGNALAGLSRRNFLATRTAGTPTYDPKQRKAEWRANQRRHKA